MENYNIILGFLQCLGIAELMGCAWPTGKIDVVHYGNYSQTAVIIRGLFNVETKIVKDAFEDAVITSWDLGVSKYNFDREAVKRRHKAAQHRMNDAIGKKREAEMADKEWGARIALLLIGE